MSGKYGRQAVAVAEGLGLTVAGVVGGILAVLALAAGVDAAGLSGSDAARLLQNTAIQPGFLAVALGFLLACDAPSKYARFRVPSARELVWILAIPVALAGIGRALDPILALVGIVPPGSTGGSPVDGFASRPLLWLVVFVGWFVVAAPSEELLFRGIVQGRLRERFDATAGVLLAAGIFGLMHFGIAFLSAGMEPVSSFVESFVGGLVFGTAYERTGNLVVPSVAHAALWTSALLLA